MSTPEGKVKDWAKRWLDYNLEGHWRYMPRGGPFGKSGTPDILICYEGLFAAIECKAEGNSLRPLQEHCIGELRHAKGLVTVLIGKNEKTLMLFAEELRNRARILWESK